MKTKTEIRLAYGWSIRTMTTRMAELRPEFERIKVRGYQYNPYATFLKVPELEIIYGIYGNPFG